MAGNYIGTLVYRITGNTDDIDKSLSQTKAKTEGFSSFLGGWASKVAGLFAAAFTVDKIVEFDKKLLQVASHSNEVSSRFENTFAGAVDKANASIVELTTNYGYSSSAAKESMSATGGLVETLGATDEVAAQMSAQVVKLGADMASYVDYAGGAKGASDALTKALLGETDASKGLSLSLGDDALSNYAASMGKVLDACTPLEKAQLRLNLAYSQAGAMGAVGDFIKTAAGYANTLRTVEGKIEDAEARAGQKLVPAVTELTAEFGRAVEPGGAFAGIIDDIASAGETAASALASLLNAMNNMSGKDKLVANKQNLESYAYQQKSILALYKDSEEELNRLAKAKDRGAMSDKIRYDALTAKIKETNQENEKLNKTLASDEKAKAQERYNELVAEDQRGQAGIIANAGRYSAKLKGMNVEQLATQKINLQAQLDAINYLDDHKKRQKEIIDLEKKYGLTIVETNNASNAPKRTPAKSGGGGGGKKSDSAKNAEDARAAIQSLDSDFTQLGVRIADLSDTELSKLSANLTQASPAVQQFVQAFGGLSNVRAFIADVNNQSLSTADVTNKWGDALAKVGNAAKNINVDSSAEEQINNALSATNKFGDAIINNQGLINDFASVGMNAFGNVANAISAMYKSKIAGLDSAMEAELEAAGLADDTEVEKANKSLALAQKSGNQTLINEKKKAANKAAIEEKYAKRKSDLEFKAAMMTYDYQVAAGATQVPLAILNALAAGEKFSPIVAGIYAGLAGLAAGASFAAVVANKPKRSSFSTGGVIGGNAYYGDKVPIWVNSKERVLTPEQNKHFEQMVYGDSSSSTGLPCHITVNLDTTPILSAVETATANGSIVIHANAVSPR